MEMGLPDRIQDAVLRLCEVATYEGLEDAFRESLQLAFQNHVAVVVYIKSSEIQDLVSSQGIIHTLPRDGITWKAMQQQERLTVLGLDASDPVSGLLMSTADPLPVQHKVLCSPVVEKQTNRVVALYVIVHDSFSQEDHQHLSFLEKQFLVCYRRLKYLPCQSSRSELNLGNKQDMAIMKLCADLYDLNVAALQLKVLQFLMEQTHSESGFLLLADTDRQELFCQVIRDEILNEELRFPINRNSFAALMKSKKSIPLRDIESVYLEKIEPRLLCEVQSSICIPVLCRSTGDVMAVTCLVNKKVLPNRFTDDDEFIVAHCFTYTAAVLRSAIALQNERKLKLQTEVLLQVATNLFTHIDDLTNLLKEIMQEAKTLTNAERCSVFLLEKESNELVSKVFDGDIHEGKTESCPNSAAPEIRVPLGKQSIAGHVAFTGELMNIDDAYSHPLFYKRIDEVTGFRTRNILCFPIKDDKGQIIGVAQLCNKINGVSFSTFDEKIAEAFSVYCCISILHSLLYKKVRDSQHRSKLSNELMIYHMQVANEDVDVLATAPMQRPTSYLGDIDKFTCIPRIIDYDTTPNVVLSMFHDMGFIARHRIPLDSLSRFVLMVRRGYRDPPYHNWFHAFSVCHFSYLLYRNLALLNYLDDVEALALFVACLCHDIDHRGTSNNYQLGSRSVLAALYSSEGSVLERHHFSQTMCILNTEGCNIFENLSKKDYVRVLDLMRDIILATDLSNHCRIVRDLEEMATCGYDRSNSHHRTLLLSILVTSCDLCDQTKNFRNSILTAELIHKEFFSEGDLVKGVGRSPLEMMDREKAIIPDSQIKFLNDYALPVYSILSDLFPETDCVLATVKHNKSLWEELKNKLVERCLPLDMTLFRSVHDLQLIDELSQT